jgi:DNA-binding response OmpR family regulator
MVYWGQHMDTSTQKYLARILLVEDDPILSKMYSTKFEIEGFEVLTAFDGEEGLKKALAEEYHLLVLDLMMPRLSGTELLVQLRNSEKGKDKLVIVITNLMDKEEQEKVKELGVYQIMTKAEITPGELVVVTKKALNL